MSQERAVRSAMQLTFWGLIVVVVDISVNNFDLVHDLIGAVLMVLAVPALAAIHVGPDLASLKGRVIVLQCVNAAVDGLLSIVNPWGTDHLLDLVLLALSLVWLHELAAFMFHLATERSVTDVAASWATTRKVVVVGGGAALFCLFIVSVSASLLFLLVLFLSVFGVVIHALVSMNRTRRRAGGFALPASA